VAICGFADLDFICGLKTSSKKVFSFLIETSNDLIKFCTKQFFNEPACGRIFAGFAIKWLTSTEFLKEEFYLRFPMAKN